MCAAGKVVWLTARPETILARMSVDDTTTARRPNLTDKTPLQEIVELLKQREPVYRESADWKVDTEGRTTEALVEEILEKCKMKNAK
jgi:shikimate kinase